MGCHRGRASTEWCPELWPLLVSGWRALHPDMFRSPFQQAMDKHCGRRRRPDCFAYQTPLTKPRHRQTLGWSRVWRSAMQRRMRSPSVGTSSRSFGGGAITLALAMYIPFTFFVAVHGRT